MVSRMSSVLRHHRNSEETRTPCVPIYKVLYWEQEENMVAVVSVGKVPLINYNALLWCMFGHAGYKTSGRQFFVPSTAIDDILYVVTD